jgi:hypothetical protein
VSLGAVLVLLVVGSLVTVYLMSRDDGDDTTTATDDAKATTATDDATEALSLPLKDAYLACYSGEGGGTLTTGDEGRTLIIDTESEYGPMGGVVCVLGELRTPQAIVAQMENTTSMMGVQEADDGNLHYQFSYHPDNGINMVITDTSTE